MSVSAGSQQIYWLSLDDMLSNLLFLLTIWKSMDVEVLIRDVGVAGSNPVTPTIDFKEDFSTDN